MILCTTAFPAFTRADSKTIVVNLWIGNSVMSVNGLRQPIDPQGTKPIIVESRTLVPIRAIVETFGGNVAWDDATKKVTINFNNNILELRIGQSTASLNGYAVQVDSTNSKVVPMIINGRTMVPLRFVAESFGINVQYEETSKMITLTYVSETTPIVQLPVAPNLISPATNSTFNNSNITFTWTAVSGVDLYKLQIIKDGLTLNSFESITTNSYTLTGTTLADGTYSWQVAAHNSTGWGSWSTPFVLVISTIQLPSAPTLTSPVTNSTFNNSNITFIWTAFSGVDYYKLQITKDNVAVNTADNINSNTYSIQAGILADGTYSWQVATHNSAGWSSWSSPFVFTISTQMSVTDIAKFVDRVVLIDVNGIKDGKPFDAEGSGFIISSDGRIVTNYHVIDMATSGTVTLNDGTKYDIISVLGYGKDKQFGDNDLAVIKINAYNLPVCILGDSDKVQLGESVVTIGSPLGLQNSVSTGIVSNIWNNSLIQITAPISHGSSGGPLFNMRGEVIGINTYGFAPIGGENINVAVPINWLKTMDTSLNMTLERVCNGWTLTPDQIKSAIDWGKTNKDDSTKFYEPFNIGSPLKNPPMQSIIITPYERIADGARNNAKEGKDFTIQDANNILSVYKGEVTFRVIESGNFADFAAYYTASITIPGVYPLSTIRKEISGGVMVDLHHYYTLIEYTFSSTQIPRHAIVKLSVKNSLQGNTSTPTSYTIDLSNYP
jgi:S1-C subfamily serine protease